MVNQLVLRGGSVVDWKRLDFRDAKAMEDEPKLRPGSFDEFIGQQAASGPATEGFLPNGIGRHFNEILNRRPLTGPLQSTRSKSTVLAPAAR